MKIFSEKDKYAKRRKMLPSTQGRQSSARVTCAESSTYKRRDLPHGINTCPKCGTRPTFNYDDNEKFICPECGSVQSGEPYLEDVRK